MWPFVLLFTARMEDPEGPGVTNALKKEFEGFLNLYWACLFGHRNGVHANMVDADLEMAERLGSSAQGQTGHSAIAHVAFCASVYSKDGRPGGEGQGLTFSLKKEFEGFLNLYWSCFFGHRNGVHANMVDADISMAEMLGNCAQGRILRVSTN